METKVLEEAAGGDDESEVLEDAEECGEGNEGA